MNTSSVSATTPPDAAPSARLRWRVLALAALFFGLLLPKLSSGTLYHHDELYTANRAREILVRGDPWTITRNFAPDFRKPPLQYWLCAAALRAFPDRPEFAVRLPSLLYGVACLLAVAFLARVSDDDDEGGESGLLAALTLAGCGYFVYFSRVGLLDTGAALHVTLAVAGCQLARRDARWWWLVGLVCVLGAWQKAPFAFAAWAVVLILRGLGRTRTRPPANLRSFRLPAAVAVSFLAASSWWGLQAFRHGFAVLRDTGVWQTHALTVPHDPGDTGFRPWLYWFWLARDWGLPGLGAPVAVVLLLRRRAGQPSGGRLPPAPVIEMAWVCAVFAAGLVFVPYRTERYLVVFTPLLSLLMVWWLRDTAARLSHPFLRPWLLPLTLASTLPVALLHYLDTKPVKADLLAAARRFGHTLQPGETPVLCAGADPGFEVAGFVEFYGGLTRPLRELRPPDIRTFPGPVRGICTRRQWPEITYPDVALKPVTTQGNWMLWNH